MKLLRSTGSVLQRLLRSPGSALALLFLLGITLAAIFADLLPLNPYAQKLVNALNGPSAANWFGTDEVGRDILARVVFGARTSLLTAAGAVAIAAVIGVPIGLVAGFFGGWRDATLMRFVDVLLALPAILFAMAMIAVLGRSQVAALIAVGITGIPSFARITRAQVLSLRRRDFVTAVEAFGGSSAYNMFRTILPNSWSPIFVQIVVLCSVAILLEAALSFLGVGVAPPTPSWGEMLRTGKSYLHEAPYYAVLPGIVLTLTILSFDVIGRSLAGILENRTEVVTPAKAGGAP
jgi:ABC-type dipeptide/oligopeptide/nickel transport system permease subunit